MKVLFLAATKSEVLFLSKKYGFNFSESNFTSFTVNKFQFDVLISGIGIYSTTYHLTKVLMKEKYNLVLNIGIAGSLRNFKIGDVINVVQDEFGDLGVEDKGKFLTLFEKGYIRASEFPFIDGKLYSDFIDFTDAISDLPEAKGITINTTHGSMESIEKVKNKFDADVESMEGAAVFYVCLHENVHCTQIRAISNIVEPMDKNNWDIELAMKNLEEVINNMIEEIC